MGKNYLLGIDCGTYEAKGTLIHRDGKVMATAAVAYQLRMPQPGFSEHDPVADWWRALKEIVAAVLRESRIPANDIAGVCISTVMAAVTPVDDTGTPLRNAILYGIDTRSLPQVERLNRAIGEENLRQVCGDICTVESYGPKIMWIRENEPDVYAKTKCFSFAAGFLTHRLTGRFVVDRYSGFAAHPMIDQRTMTWHPTYTAQVCDPSMLPEIVRTTDVVGTVTKAAALETGLAAGTPVLAGTTDGGADALSVGVVESGDCMVNYGSTIFLSYVGESVPAQTGLWEADYILPGLRCLMAGMGTAGSLTRWLRDQVGKDLLLRQEKTGENAYAALFQEAAEILPGAEGLLMLPYFMGERMPIADPLAKGAILGLTLRHTRGHLVKAALEGIGYGLDQLLSLLRKGGQPPQIITAVGGGTNAQVWMQTMCDVCGIHQQIPSLSMGASYGDALLAGLGTGLIARPGDIKEMIQYRQTLSPKVDTDQVYGQRKRDFALLYQGTREIMHRLG